MPYSATVIPVMIASPSDVDELKMLARQMIHDWNAMHSAKTNVVLLPVGWESHSSPELGAPAQDLINERVLKDCDLLVGIFWARVGTPTEKALSGSVEEIKRHLEAGKPAMVYFSTQPVALDSVDPEQYEKLKEFKKWCMQQGLIEQFGSLQEFSRKFGRQLQVCLNENPYLRRVADEKSPIEPVAGDVIDGPNNLPAAIEQERNLTSKHPGKHLSLESRTLLREAASSKSGMVFKKAFIGGTAVNANSKTLNDPSSNRSVATWEHAINELRSHHLIDDRSGKGELFFVTKLGYDLSDQITAFDKGIE